MTARLLKIFSLWLLLFSFILTGCIRSIHNTEKDTETDNTETKDIDIKDTEEMKVEALRPTATLVLEVNGKTYYPELEKNSSADAFFEKLRNGRLEMELHDYGNFEKVGELPWELPRNDEEITTVSGDIILYQGNQLSIYYDENTWSLTRLARIKWGKADDLKEVLGEGDVTAVFWLEWSE